MKEISVEKIVQVTRGVLIRGDPLQRVTGVTVDSRCVAEGNLFCAIKGEKADGHDYVLDAFSKGAVASLVSKEVEVPSDFSPQKALILVPDTVKALGDLARFYLDSLDVTVIGVTGSVGKTSTKDMIYSVLRKRFRVGKNPGNLNSDIGLCLAAFQLDPGIEIAVLEMAMRAVGEIKYLASIARPTYGVLTDISQSHIGVVGSLEKIARGKAELIEALPADGIAFLNGDNSLIREVTAGVTCRKVFYGFGPDCQYRAEGVTILGEEGAAFTLRYPGGEIRAKIPVPGRHQVQNALCAAAVGFELGMTSGEVVSGLGDASLSGMRTALTHAGRLTILDDSYNSSPVSCKAALDLLCELPGERKVAILGDMLELGEWAPEAHREVGRYAAGRVDVLVTQGDLARYIADGAIEASGLVGRATEVTWVPDRESARRFLAGSLKAGDVVLVKASRAMKFEEYVEFLKAKGREMGADE
ncbi:MAG: UDP-N-acetylmuramoyl-tripeptide--D-alanyl-D-alanine ligase [Firmicutes bacterium]|nr:UDP-N-acetylmuramoyl-tripeptide--D-alanyl-D-alanine ligase [Candidatus Fermentithermobacillaceae bacterium]